LSHVDRHICAAATGKQVFGHGGPFRSPFSQALLE
jgi:hypothetical protein